MSWPYKWAAVPMRWTNSVGWHECNPHQVELWVAFNGDRILGKYKRKADALEAIRVSKARHAKLPRNYKLGKEMGKRT